MLGAALEQCCSTICGAVAKEALSQTDIVLIEELVRAIEASTDPESRTSFVRHACELRVLCADLDTHVMTLPISHADESRCA